MSKTLEERLKDVRNTLGEIDSAMGRHLGKLPGEVEESFRKALEYRSSIDHWKSLLQARYAAKQFLDGLEAQVDDDDCIEIVAGPMKFQNIRQLGVHGYITIAWALADSITGLVGRVLCSPEAGFNDLMPARLVAHFVEKGANKTTSASHSHAIRHTFGWPIAIAYAIRNHFVHEGAFKDGSNFFEGPTAISAFRISEKGWDLIVEMAKEKGVNSTQHRGGPTWLTAPRNDLRMVLSDCEREMDDALGILIGSACNTLKMQVALMLGED